MALGRLFSTLTLPGDGLLPMLQHTRLVYWDTKSCSTTYRMLFVYHPFPIRLYQCDRDMRGNFEREMLKFMPNPVQNLLCSGLSGINYWISGCV